jgi:hypothetical protein
MRAIRASLPAALLLVQAPAPAQEAAAPSLAQRLKASEAEITKLLAALDGRGALAKCEALLPAAKPAFAKANPRAGLESSQEYSALMALYGLTAKAAISSGDWEKGKDYLEKAQGIARENHAETTTVIAPLLETWTKALEASKKALEDGAARRKELEAKEKDKLAPEEQQELDNFKVHDNNLKNGPTVINSLQGSLDGLKADAAGFDGAISSIDKKIKEESESLGKFKGDKAAYVKAVLSNKANLAAIEKPVDKAGWLNRLLFLAPSSAQAQKQLDIVLGKAPAEPEKKAAKPKKKA